MPTFPRATLASVLLLGTPDGLKWSQPSILRDFRQDPDQPNIYVAPMGKGDDPGILGKQFYLLYTRSPAANGWEGASVHRLDVSCQ